MHNSKTIATYSTDSTSANVKASISDKSKVQIAVTDDSRDASQDRSVETDSVFKAINQNHDELN